jgi:hypothetical protein
MMFILFGLSTKVRELPSRATTCQYCGAFAQQYLEERATRFTLFFIPVITTSRSHQLTCSNCGRRSKISGRQKNTLVR